MISFDSFWGHPEGLKGSKATHFSKNNSTEAENLHKEVISHQKFDIVPDLGQTTNFDPFWDTPVVKWGSKNIYRANNNPQKLQIRTRRYCHPFNMILHFFFFFFHILRALWESNGAKNVKNLSIFLQLMFCISRDANMLKSNND